jgi:hypothetical protein
MAQKSTHTELKEACEIQRLKNSIYFGVGIVFVFFSEKGFRLIGINDNKKVLVDRHYKTLRGAKIAFSKFFQQYALVYAGEQKVRAIWSHTYNADWAWLKLIIDLCNRESKTAAESDLVDKPGICQSC